MIESTRKGDAKRRIIGISLSPQKAAEVKAEAKRRGIPLNRLFDELWQLYQKSAKKPKP